MEDESWEHWANLEANWGGPKATKFENKQSENLEKRWCVKRVKLIERSNLKASNQGKQNINSRKRNSKRTRKENENKEVGTFQKSLWRLSLKEN